MEKLGSASTSIHKVIMGEIHRINESAVVFFTRGDIPPNLGKDLTICSSALRGITSRIESKSSVVFAWFFEGDA